MGKQIDGYGEENMEVPEKIEGECRYTERECSLKHKIPSEKVSLYTSWKKKIKKASLTVETALVLPLFFFGMVTLISFMDIYRIQTQHLTALCQRAKEAGIYAYVMDGKGPDEITLPDMYVYQPVGGIIALPKVRNYNQVKVHAWTGADHKSGQQKETKAIEQMVYVTESGRVYHKDPGCSHLKLSVTRVSGNSISGRRNDQGGKYHACESCSRNQKPSGSVYITRSGNRYHNDRNCSGLKRTVRLVRESELSDMAACSRCG